MLSRLESSVNLLFLFLSTHTRFNPGSSPAYHIALQNIIFQEKYFYSCSMLRSLLPHFAPAAVSAQEEVLDNLISFTPDTAQIKVTNTVNWHVYFRFQESPLGDLEVAYHGVGSILLTPF
jgi:hypothetical protein